MADRRDFLKTMAIGGASALVAPSLLSSCTSGAESSIDTSAGGLIVPKDNGLRITGTFLDEISHDIPHQNWGEKEWDQDFAYTVKDSEGNAVSKTLNYSVKDWCIAVYPGSGASSMQSYLVRALYNLGVSAAAYKASL